MRLPTIVLQNRRYLPRKICSSNPLCPGGEESEFKKQMGQPTKPHHYENSILVPAAAAAVFSFADDHAHFSAHMTQSSWLMGGGSMKIETDSGKGQKVGSHIKMGGRVFGIYLFLDEIITVYNPPMQKEWQTVGNLNLLVIGHYLLGFEIKPDQGGSKFRVYIDYELPKSAKTLWLGKLFGAMYAKWCVKQMINSVSSKFNSKS